MCLCCTLPDKQDEVHSFRVSIPQKENQKTMKTGAYKACLMTFAAAMCVEVTEVIMFVVVMRVWLSTCGQMMKKLNK